MLVGLLPLAAAAQRSERDVEKEQRYWQELQSIAPDALESFKAATVASDKGDSKKAIELYQAVYKKAPNFDVVIRRLGAEFVRSGRKPEGMALLEEALKRKESPENLITIALALAFNPDGTPADPDDLERALPYARHAADLYQGSDEVYLITFAIVAQRTHRMEYVRIATRRLLAEHDDLMLTHYFAALVAASDKDWTTSAAEVTRAQALGLPATQAAAVLALNDSESATVRRYVYISMYAAGIWVAGLLMLFVLGKAFSKAALRWIEASDPDAATATGHARLRTAYRWLMNIAGAYYYASMPIVILLLLGFAASLVYGAVMVRHMPFRVFRLMPYCFGAILIIYPVIRSLFIKLENEDPGRALGEDEAPGLWALAREVARTVGTRPIDEIRITPATELAVYERGSLRRRARDQGQRVLVLGIANLDDFEQDAFRAVLAHEYGHFRHGDTAGGDVAIRVNNDIIKFALALKANGQAVWYNLAFHFLRVYHFIFRRISRGATRLQEVMADRVAAINYSPQAFERGLRHVIRRRVEFGDMTHWELTDTARGKRALQNLYELPVSNQSHLEERISEALSRQTSDDDTHPAPEERFRLVRRIRFTGTPASAGLVWDLFADRAGLTAEMNALIKSARPV